MQKLNLIALEGLKVPVIFNDKVMQQIQYLCRVISKDEWSGILFYQVKGTIRNISKFSIHVKAIFPMDRGSAAYTAHEYDSTLIEFRMSHPESLKWTMGKIHSHNIMGTTFSGTDYDELKDNTQFYNYYLSVIVNNAMSINAKIAFVGSLTGYAGQDEDGKPFRSNAPISSGILVVDGNPIIQQSGRVDKYLIDKTKEITAKPLAIPQASAYGYAEQLKVPFNNDQRWNNIVAKEVLQQPQIEDFVVDCEDILVNSICSVFKINPPFGGPQLDKVMDEVQLKYGIRTIKKLAPNVVDAFLQTYSADYANTPECKGIEIDIDEMIDMLMQYGEEDILPKQLAIAFDDVQIEELQDDPNKV